MPMSQVASLKALKRNTDQRERERAGWVGFRGRREEGGKPKSSEAAKISLAKVFYY